MEVTKASLENKNILAIDYGTKVTGLAAFCPGRDPFPYPIGKINYRDDQSLIKEIEIYVNDQSSDIIVLGLPLRTDGSESEMTKKVQHFGKQLQQHFSAFTLFYQDEYLSSFEAQERMKRSPRYHFKVNPEEIDALAATIILEDFIKKFFPI